MVRLCLLGVLILAPFLASAQVVDKKVQTFVGQTGVDTFMVYSYPCSRGFLSMDTCAFEDAKYLFWQSGGHFFVRKFDYCKTYRIIEIDSSSPLPFYLAHKRAIDRDTIKPPTYFIVKRNRNKIDTIIESSVRDHSCYPTFLITMGNQTVKKQADDYDLEFDQFDDGRENVFRAYNNSTKFKALIDRTKACIKELEVGYKFIEE